MVENERATKLQMAKLLVCCLFFTGMTRIPTNKNLLDGAIKSARRRGAFPPWGKRGLHFADGRTGTVCVELDELLQLASSCGFLEYDSSYCLTKVVVSRWVILKLLREELGVGKKKARKWGRFIREGFRAGEGSFYLGEDRGL